MKGLRLETHCSQSCLGGKGVWRENGSLAVNLSQRLKDRRPYGGHISLQRGESGLFDLCEGAQTVVSPIHSNTLSFFSTCLFLTMFAFTLFHFVVNLCLKHRSTWWFSKGMRDGESERERERGWVGGGREECTSSDPMICSQTSPL